MTYDMRQISSIILALFASVIVNHYFAWTQEGWLIISAIMMSLITRGNTLNRDFIYFVFLSLIAILVPPHQLMQIRYRIVDVSLGASIALVLNQWIFPVDLYREFRLGLLPILHALNAYLETIPLVLAHPHQAALLKEKKIDIQKTLIEKKGHYPEWVYAIGFNPGLRAGYRYFLIQIEKACEICFALHFLISDCSRKNMTIPFLDEMNHVLVKNSMLCLTLINHFNENPYPKFSTDSDFKQDILMLEEALQHAVPYSVEWLDLAPSTLPLVAIVRDLKDLREILLQLILSTHHEQPSKSN